MELVIGGAFQGKLTWALAHYGLTMEDVCDLPEGRVKDVLGAIEDYPAVLPALLELARAIRETSFCTLAQALRLMFPAQMRGERIAEKTKEFAVLTVERLAAVCGLAEALRRFSAEIEHNDDNLDALLEALRWDFGPGELAAELA